MRNRRVTVVIPTFNRAHLLNDTIPSYIQDEVLEVIVIDDASTDNTIEVLTKLSQNNPRIKFLSNQKNIKQTGSKNIGILQCKTKYIYFGDDDSFLLSDSIHKLVNTMEVLDADIVGARALYMAPGESLIDTLQNNNITALSSIEVFNPLTFEHNFNMLTNSPILVSTCQACFLIKTEIAIKYKFCQWFIGPCQREESDYLIKLSAAGYQIYYESSACQINLPRNIAYGGAWSNVYKREFCLIYNHCIFTFRNFFFLKKIGGIYFIFNYLVFIYKNKFKYVYNNLLKNIL